MEDVRGEPALDAAKTKAEKDAVALDAAKQKALAAGAPVATIAAAQAMATHAQQRKARR